MSKRRLSPTLTVVPPPKRVHSSGAGDNMSSSTPLSFDLALYDELILTIFSYLSYRDLCALQRTSSNWSRLSLDNQLWRNLYLLEFGRSRLRGSKGFAAYATARSDGRDVRPLPGRAQAQAEAVKDWKWMFRISSNWRTGRCVTEELTWEDAEDFELPVHAALAGGLMLTASPLPSPSPQILLHRPPRPPHPFSASSIPPNPFNKVTSLALDQSQPTSPASRLLAFYSTGDFCLFLTSHLNPEESTEVLSYVPTTHRRRAAPITQAVYHHPLLVTLSASFDLSIYELPSSQSGSLPSGIRLTQTLTSFTSYPPTSLILSSPSPDIYKLVLVYAVPIYPSHWTVAVTELIISSFAVQSTQTTSAFDLTSGWSPLTPMLTETLREQYSRKISKISSTSTDGKYVALAGAGTNAIQLYRLSSRSRAAGPKLTFVRTLHGHVSPVQALCVADGRCVSLSRDGCLWVWDLERGGVEVESEGMGELPETARVAFDERRIFVVLNGRVIIRRFDM